MIPAWLHPRFLSGECRLLPKKKTRFQKLQEEKNEKAKRCIPPFPSVRISPETQHFYKIWVSSTEACRQLHGDGF